jgi:hypothetical protein
MNCVPVSNEINTFGFFLSSVVTQGRQSVNRDVIFWNFRVQD